MAAAGPATAVEARPRRSARRSTGRTPRRRRPRDPCPAATARLDPRPKITTWPPRARLTARPMPRSRARRHHGPISWPCARPVPRSGAWQQPGPISRSNARRHTGPVSRAGTRGHSRPIPRPMSRSGAGCSRPVPRSSARHSGPMPWPARQQSRQVAMTYTGLTDAGVTDAGLADPGTVAGAQAAGRPHGSRLRRKTARPGGPSNRPARAAHSTAGAETRIVRAPDSVVGAAPGMIGADAVPAVDVDVHAAVAAAPVRAGPAPETRRDRHAGAEYQPGDQRAAIRIAVAGGRREIHSP
jgi:hypothetical protein